MQQRDHERSMQISFQLGDVQRMGITPPSPHDLEFYLGAYFIVPSYRTPSLRTLKIPCRQKPKSK